VGADPDVVDEEDAGADGVDAAEPDDEADNEGGEGKEAAESKLMRSAALPPNTLDPPVPASRHFGRGFLPV
jgi:hypothetical protein